MGKPSSHRWYIASFRISGLPRRQHRDLPVFGDLILQRFGLGITGVTESTSGETVVAALLAGRLKHTTLQPPPRPEQKANVKKRLTAISFGSLFDGALETGLGAIEWSLQPVSSSSIHLIQAIICSEGRQFTGFTEAQLQQVHDDPVGVLHLPTTTSTSMASGDTQDCASTEHAAAASMQVGTDSNICESAAPLEIVPKLGPYCTFSRFENETRLPVTEAMCEAVDSWPHFLPQQQLVVMPDASLVQLLPGKVLGTGSYSKVVVGTRIGGAAVAVKMPLDDAVMDPRRPGQTPEKDIWYDCCFLPELRALQAAGSHESLLKCHGWGLHWGSGMPVIVFDQANYSLAETGPRTLAETSAFFHQLLCVLDHLHRQGIWHRDIKPGNLLLTSKPAEGRHVLQLADLGESRVAHLLPGPQPTYAGTEGYMAPEQEDAVLAPSSGCWDKADVWSAGVTLLEMVGGQVYIKIVEKGYLATSTSWPATEVSSALTGTSAKSTGDSSAIRAAALSRYTDPAARIKEEMERLKKKMPEQVQQLELAEDLVCRMLVVDPEQRPAAADLLDHPFFELGILK